MGEKKGLALQCSSAAVTIFARPGGALGSHRLIAPVLANSLITDPPEQTIASNDGPKTTRTLAILRSSLTAHS
jgi:hypothetical protein